MLGIRVKRQNRFKRRQPGKNRPWVSGGLKVTAGAVGVALLSIVLIFCHDLITQCDAFKAQTVTVTGARRLSRAEICERAGILPGANILAVNLIAARKRLLADPWIADAQIRRDIPDGIHVAVREHRALAVIDLGRKFLLDDAGTIFKEAVPPEDENLPLVEGLRYADIELRPFAAGDRNPAAPFSGVVAVLQLGRPAASVIPNRHLARIMVDSETGITLKTLREPKTVVLGFRDYATKYAVLQRLLAHLAQRRPNGWGELETVDLNNLNRIVVQPLYDAAAGSDKPAVSGQPGRKISDNESVADPVGPAPV